MRQPVDGNAVRVDQLRHLVEIATHPQVTPQVLPTETRARSGRHGAFTILQFPHDPEITDPGTVYVETLPQGLWYEAVAAFSAVHTELERIVPAPHGRSKIDSGQPAM